MQTYNSRIVKAMASHREPEYYPSLTDCARAYGLRYEAKLIDLIENGGLAPDGRTFFDYPTDVELEEIATKKIILTRRG